MFRIKTELLSMMKLIFLILISVTLFSCSNLKYLGENEALYTGSEVKVEEADKEKKKSR